MKKYIVVSGGAGFVGSNLIKYLLLKTKNKIISLDNYSSGFKLNHVKNKRVNYINGDTRNFQKIFEKYKKNIDVIFHFGEFSRIHQSFIDTDKCFSSNICGTSNVFYFCLKNKIKIIYSATSASLGNKGNDQSLSPYAFTKSKNLQLLSHLDQWFGLSYEVLYFYNVYGPGHIKSGPMATVIGIFEDQYQKKIPLTVARPGSQSRKFTHIHDTVKGCYHAWKKNKNRYYSLSNMRAYSIKRVANYFSKNITMIPAKRGERKKSSIVKMVGKTKIYHLPCTADLRTYIKEFKNNLINNSAKS
jgi:UDP-glucose 4-epimerase